MLSITNSLLTKKGGEIVLKIAVCDDDIDVVNIMDSILEDIAKTNNLSIETDCFFSGEKLLDHMKTNNVLYDLMFLDIEMEDMDGLKTAKCIREFNNIVYLIYVTSHEQYALDAYEVHPYQFIVKPITKEIVEKHLLSIYEILLSEKSYFEYMYKKNYYRILVNDIKYFESDKRVVKIYMQDGSFYIYYDKLDSIEEKLKGCKADFWRVHQSFLVNARFIRTKGHEYVELVDGVRCLISQDRRKDINRKYISVIERKDT